MAGGWRENEAVQKKNPGSIKAFTDVLIKDNKKVVTVETNIKSCNI